MNSTATLEEDSESSSCGVVRALYDALQTRDVDTVHRIVAPDLEWWFHGPPTHQFLMRLLTGTATPKEDRFEFVPDKITSLGPIVLAEGCDQGRSICWVHACTVTHGVITQVREYLNTSLTVTRLGSVGKNLSDIASTSSSSPSSQPHWPSVWESSLSSQVGKSVPGLVLAI
ncbi:hypothetical protein CDL15_Pgr025751 [Punica granatum]|uniref:Wound-induced protein 1 n=3 Tax=Punica granatum TaxID=22663 RepID=A0A218WCU3_PUNGR|nr:hypothetical protein CDL15_Pgr025751 [Punica granatum]